MNHEEGFLQAIAEHPDDDTHRLIYADWLEERGDPRGEYLRLECLLVRTWARLGELRPQVDRVWADQVGHCWRVSLLGYEPEMKIAVIKAIREVTGLGLKDAKDRAEQLPSVIADCPTRAAAEAVARRVPTGRVNIEPRAVSLIPPEWLRPLPAPSPPLRFQVWLESFNPDDRLQVIAAVRQLTRLPMVEARNRCQPLPQLLSVFSSSELADRAAQSLSRFAVVRIQPV